MQRISFLSLSTRKHAAQDHPTPDPGSANRTIQLLAVSGGVVLAVLVSILIGSTVGVGIGWLRTAAGILVGLLAFAICGTLALLVIARDPQEESRQQELTAIQDGEVLETGPTCRPGSNSLNEADPGSGRRRSLRSGPAGEGPPVLDRP